MILSEANQDEYNVSLTDDEKRLKAGQESVDIIRESYSLQQNIDKLERVYTEVERLRDDKL